LPFLTAKVLNGVKMILAPIVEIFCDIDEFYKSHSKKTANKLLPLPQGKRQRKTELSESEMITIMILFHLSHYRTFKDYYLDCVLGQLSREFPKAVSYPRFVALMPRLLAPLTAYVLLRAGDKTGLYYLDSTKMVVCHNRRIYRNKVFKGIAERGHCSVGFFYGFKLHLAINHKGEIMSFCITKGNVDDREVVEKLMQGLTGLSAADKGYISKKLTESLAEQGIKLITKVRKNMKKKMLSAFEKFFLYQRSIVETVIDQLKSICHIEHTRHRSPINFLVNLVSGLAGYCLKPKKPSIGRSKFRTNSQALIHN
jgi:hypothetical protein